MATTEFIAAIEVGSTRITGVVGKKISDGSLQILAYANEEASSFIRKGVVYNLDKTATCLTSIINKLEEKLDGKRICKVYTCIGGKSMRTVKNIVTKNLEKETVLSDEIIDEIKDENLATPFIDMDVLGVEPQEYKIDHLLQADPKGIPGTNIEGRFLNIVARNSSKKNLVYSFQKAKTEIADLMVAPLVCADAVLTENEKRAGCVLVNLGADTTTVSIYKNNILRYLAVIPLGGKSISHDLTSLEIEDCEAEAIKLKYGEVLYQCPEEEVAEITSIDGKKLSLEDINNLVEARAQEIIENVNNQIELSGYAGKLLSGMIITGGGARLKNIDAMLRQTCRIEKIRTAKNIQTSITADNIDIENFLKDNNIMLTTVLGMLAIGDENCCQEESIEPQPVHEEKEMTLFEGDESLKEQEDKARMLKKIKEKEEKENAKRMKEEEKRRREEEKRNKKNNKSSGGFFDNFLKGLSEKSEEFFSSDNEMK